jgi:hypothetical protein
MTIKNKQQNNSYLFYQRKSDMLATILNLIEIISNTIFFFCGYLNSYICQMRIFCMVLFSKKNKKNRLNYFIPQTITACYLKIITRLS